jgi:pimeloyl-ACP methyl ester carboxylesterase
LVFVALATYFGITFGIYNGVPFRNLACGTDGVDGAACTEVGNYMLLTRFIGDASSNLTPVIVLHGGPGHGMMSFKGSLDRLASGGRPVLFYDQQGSGHSEMKDSKKVRVSTLIEEVENLRKQLLHDADKIILFGHSAGGAVVQQYAAKYPDRLEKMILMGSSVAVADNYQASHWVMINLGPGLYTTDIGSPPQNPSKADTWLNDLPNSHPLANPAHNSTILDDTGPIRYTTWWSVSKSFAGYDTKLLGGCPAPVLAIYGDHDNDYTGKGGAKSIAKSFPNAVVVGIPDSSHWPFLENPSGFWHAVESFL